MRILGAILVLIGSINVPWSIVASAEAVASARWPTTAGIIQSSAVQAVSAGGRGGTTYVPTVAYTYEVNGRRLVGTRIWHVKLGFLSVDAREIAETFTPGSNVIVHFNPKRPNVSLLRPGLTRYSVGWILLSCCTLLLGLVFFSKGGRRQVRSHAVNS
jgi:Protein of unknown function (DUF3592)